MTAVCACPACDKPAHNGFLCATCITTLGNDLKAVPDLLVDLEVTITRQDKIGDRQDGGRPSERPLPLRVGPMEARRYLVEALTNWACGIAGDLALFAGERPDKGAAAAEYLVAYLDRVALYERAGDLADEIGYAVINGQRAVDKPLQPVFAGPCGECKGYLYAHPKAAEVACRECGHTYVVADRQRWMLGQIEDQVSHSAILSGFLRNLGVTIAPSTIRHYASKGRIKVISVDANRRALYRVGDILDVFLKRQY